MPDPERTGSHPIVVPVAWEGLDFNGRVAAIRPAVAPAGGTLGDRWLRTVERQAQGRGRRNAVDQQVLVPAEDGRSFGQPRAWPVARRLDLARRPNQLFWSDGEEGGLRLARRHVRPASVLLDRFRVPPQLRRAFGRRTPGDRMALATLGHGRLATVRSLLACVGRIPRCRCASGA